MTFVSAVATVLGGAAVPVGVGAVGAFLRRIAEFEEEQGPKGPAAENVVRLG